MISRLTRGQWRLRLSGDDAPDEAHLASSALPEPDKK